MDLPGEVERTENPIYFLKPLIINYSLNLLCIFNNPMSGIIEGLTPELHYGDVDLTAIKPFTLFPSVFVCHPFLTQVKNIHLKKPVKLEVRRFSPSIREEVESRPIIDSGIVSISTSSSVKCRSDFGN